MVIAGRCPTHGVVRLDDPELERVGFPSMGAEIAWQPLAAYPDADFCPLRQCAERLSHEAVSPSVLTDAPVLRAFLAS